MRTGFATVAQLAAAAALSSLGIAAAPALAQTPNFPQYRASIKQLGLTPLIPASTSFQPGYIYRLRRNDAGNVFQQSVCKQAFTVPAVTSTISFPDETVARETGFDLSLKFLPAALANKVKAALGVNVSKISNVSISIPRATQFEVAQMVSLDPKTGAKVRRTLTADCAEILQNLPRNPDGGFRVPLYMVISSVSPDAMKFTFDQTSGGALSIDADAAASFTVGTGMKMENKTNQSFVLARTGSAPRQFIAANIIRLESANPNAEVSSTPYSDMKWQSLPADAPVFSTEAPR